MKTNLRRRVSLNHRFVDLIPEADQLEDRTIYISIAYATAAHKCCCGCGREVFTPLSPTDWQLVFDGVSVSLTPSIGNWSFPCQSHYWIRNNEAQWALPMSKYEIDIGRAADRAAKRKQFGQLGDVVEQETRSVKPSLWARILSRIRK
jgi:hypothetical protein